MKKRILNSIKMIAILVFAVFLYAFSSSRSANRKIQAVQMNFDTSTNLLVSRPDVLKEINHFIEAKKTKIGAIDNKVIARIEHKLLENKLLEEATAFVTLDDTLRIIVKQKKPIARIVGSSNYYLDINGKKMPLSKNYTQRVPLVYGSFTADELMALKHLITSINANEFLKKQLVAIYKKKNNSYEFEGRLGNQRVIFGTLEHKEKKLKKLELFYKDSWSKKRLNNYKTINLKYHNQIVCTKI
jgi:cell division protein FtsQ